MDNCKLCAFVKEVRYAEGGAVWKGQVEELLWV